MQDKVPTISVVIPAYNRDSTIGHTLDSLLSQTYADWEAIVVDDGSRDETLRVAQNYAERDDRIGVHSRKNQGVSAARNAGIDLCRGEWLFFLDADDWIVPTSFSALLGPVGEAPGEVDAVYGGYVRIDEMGNETRERRPPHNVDLFPVFAQMCAFSIHSCLMRTQLIRAAGCFDETLITCEDWDLWQRIARAGARFAAIPDFIAYYRMRSDSASANGERMLADGLRVIERGHSEDPRVESPKPRHRAGAPPSNELAAKVYFVCYAAGLVMSNGADAAWMIEKLGPAGAADVQASGVAETLFLAVPNGRAGAPSEWPRFPPEVLDRCRGFIDAVGAWMGDNWFGFQGQRALERLILAATEGPKPRTAGAWHLMEVDCAGEPPGHVAAAVEVEHILCEVKVGPLEIGTVELPAEHGWVSPRVIADRIADQFAWEVLGAWLNRDMYGKLRIDQGDGSIRVSRGDSLLVESLPPDPSTPFDDWLHDSIGWTILLQEVWGHRSWSSDEFYSHRPEPAVASPIQADSARPVTVELSEPLPPIRCPDGSAAVCASLAGIPLVTIRLPTTEGEIRPHDLRRGALLRLGFEFCRGVVRELILGRGNGEEASLRAILSEAADRRSAIPTPDSVWVADSDPRPLAPGWHRGLGELLPPDGGATVIGQRAVGGDGTAISRYATMPSSSEPELAASAVQNRDPMIKLLDDGPSRCVAYAPCVQWDRSEEMHSDVEDLALLSNLEFEHTFAARPDPWRYRSDYEQRKYAQTLSLIPEGVEHALEIGCAEGTFTAELAERVGSVLACDVSNVALARASRRCSHLKNVQFSRLDLFEDEIPTGYDLIISSEILYYAWNQERLARTIRRLATALAPGGHLLCANAQAVVDDPAEPGFDWDVPFGAKQIEKSILSSKLFDLVEEIRTAPYRVQLYRRRDRRRLTTGRPRGRSISRPAAGEMTRSARARFQPEGGNVRRIAEVTTEGAGPALPILMYHRVAPSGAANTSRWRIHPRDFEEQLEFLRSEGYYSLTLEQLRAAANSRRTLPGKPIVLTFDDGYVDFLDEAAPLLASHGFTATVFVVSELVGKSNEWDAELGEQLSLMNWGQIGELLDQGFEIGSHSARHSPLVALDRGTLTEDLVRSKRLLDEKLGQPITSLSYPFGLHDALVENTAGACGYQSAVTTDQWLTSWADSLLALPRIEICGPDPIDVFASLLVS